MVVSNAPRLDTLKILFVVYAFGQLFATIYYFWNGVYLQRGYPYTSYLCLPSARFTDYDNMIYMCRNLNPYHDHTRSGYPPFANLLFYLFGTFSIPFGFFLYVVTPLIFVRWAINRLLIRQSVLLRTVVAVFLVIFSYPFLFTLDRGNVEFYIIIALGTFFILYDSAKPFERDLAIFALAAGISIKIYPILLVIVPFKDRRYIDCFKILVLFVLLTVGSAATFTGGASGAFSDFRHMIATTDELVKNQLQYAHGNAGLFYAGVIILKLTGWSAGLKLFYSTYWIVAFIILASYCWLIAVSRLSYWASCTCLVCLMCIVPSLSNDYRTAQILIPMIMFAVSDVPKSKTYCVIAILFALLLVPRNYLILFPDVGPGDVGIGGVITPLLLLALMNMILFAEGWSFRKQGVTVGVVSEPPFPTANYPLVPQA